MDVSQQLKLKAVDTNGLNRADRSRIENIGFDAWLDEESKRAQERDRARHKAAWFRKAGYNLNAEAARCPELGKVASFASSLRLPLTS